MSAPARPVPASVGSVRVSPFKCAWLWGHVAVVAWLAPRSLSLQGAAAAVVLAYVTLCLGHSVGLHRGIIHRTYRTSLRFERALVTLFLFTGLGGPLTWVRLHRVRDHWQNRADCPDYFAYRHGVIRDLWWNMHCEFRPVDWDRYALDERVQRDPWYRALERVWFVVVLASYGALYLAFGLEVAVVCGVSRVAASMLGHWFIGWWTHARGERRFELRGATEHGTNSLVLGWISFGEGFHNNHHAFPDSARMGIEARELDLGWITILALERLGCVADVRSWSRGNVAAEPRRRRAIRVSAVSSVVRARAGAQRL